MQAAPPPPSSLDGKRLAVWAAGLVLVLVAGLALWPLLRPPVAAGFCGAANRLLLDHVTFGKGGRARLQPEPDTVRRSGDGISSDTRAVLSVDGFEGELGMGISLRHDLYLPLLVLIGTLAAAPLRPRARGLRLLIAVPAIVLLGFGAQWLFISWTFTHQLQGVSDAGAAARGALDLAYRALLLPPSIRIVGALALGVLLVLSGYGPQRVASWRARSRATTDS